ncbi:unnamed protein product [Ilex paraguariensis]|uniref:Uncharacterized protein n=1 Tax=Ilex paraguariensis TaxID=185542 RepID=A0ABC8V1U7_9AQUA
MSMVVANWKQCFNFEGLTARRDHAEVTLGQLMLLELGDLPKLMHYGGWFPKTFKVHKCKMIEEIIDTEEDLLKIKILDEIKTSIAFALETVNFNLPPLSQSPPLSPIKAQVMSGYSPISRYSDRMLSVDSCGLNRLSQFNNGSLSYKDVLTELMSSLETMNVNEASHASDKNRKLSWVDVNFNGDDQQQFILSPSTPSPSGFAHFLAGDCSSRSFVDDKFNESGLADPDLGWVNDLLT